MTRRPSDGDVLGRLFAAAPLHALDTRGRAEVLAAATQRTLEAGAVLCVPGEPADAVFVLGRGAVRLERPGGGTRAAERTLRAGQLFGEEALAPFSARRARAVVVEPALVFEVPVGVLRRALERAGAAELLAREELGVRRALWLELLESSALGRLPRVELERLLGALVEERRSRGERLFAHGDPAGDVWFVAGGLVELTRPPKPGDPPLRPLYAAQGDLLGLFGARSAGCHGITAVALGDVLALRFPAATWRELAHRHPEVSAALEQWSAARREKQRRTLEAAPAAVTRRATDELERLRSASSLLAIDLERCVQCGHCVWACADAHGSARLERRGDKVVVALREADALTTRALFFPTACQHCHEPVCLSECPTAAIGRDATGAVLIREDKCTGCGACAKACPWDAIRMAPRGAVGSENAPTKSAEVAVKCDLCRGHDGPECVSACPTNAIFRIDPKREVVEVAAALGRVRSVSRAPAVAGKGAGFATLAVLASVPPALALARVAARSPALEFAAGVLAALLVVLLAGHAVLKRSRRVRSVARRLSSGSSARSSMPSLVGFHAVTGTAALLAVLVHAGFRVPGGAAGALALTFWAVAGSGIFGACAYRWLPARLARLERRSLLPEDFAAEREALWDGLHAQASGDNAAKKSLIRRVLLPYARARTGALVLALSGRSLAREEAALALSIERTLAGRRSERLGELEPLIRNVVEMRALEARRLVGWALRAWLSVHLLGTALLLVLLVLHVAGALR